MTESKYGHIYAAENFGTNCIGLWMTELPLQQQSVLLLALRGPDGVRKYHPAKAITVAYRGTILCAAERGRFLYLGEKADDFMSLHVFGNMMLWQDAIRIFFQHVDELPHHYVSHLAHAAQIIAYHHPEPSFAQRWRMFYMKWVNDLHLDPETIEQMDHRLGDFGQHEKRVAERNLRKVE